WHVLVAAQWRAQRHPLSLLDALPISTGVPGQRGERDLVLDVKPEDLPAPGRVHDLHGASRLPWLHHWGAVAVQSTVDGGPADARSEEHTSELQSRENLVCRLLLEKKK